MPTESQQTPEDQSPDTESKTKTGRALLKRVLDQRIAAFVTLLGTLFGFIGIGLSIYFYRETRDYPDLSYYVHPVKASVLRAGQASKLKCDFEGQSITSDITVAQVAIWNEGKKSIKKDNILKPLVLYLPTGTPILEATLRKQSRDVVNLELDRKDLSNGRLLVSWTILERNDGAVIQLTYAGNSEAPIVLDGVVEGQGNMRRVDYGQKLPSQEEQYRVRASSDRSFRWIMLGMGIIAMTISLITIKRYPSSDKVQTFMNIMGIIMGVGIILIFVILGFMSLPSGPPFGFD